MYSKTREERAELFSPYCIYKRKARSVRSGEEEEGRRTCSFVNPNPKGKDNTHMAWGAKKKKRNKKKSAALKELI